MSFGALLDETVTITTMAPGAADIYGNKPLTAGATATVRARIQELPPPVEMFVGRETAVTLYRAFLPAGTVIGYLDQITRASGAVLEVNGHPNIVDGRTGPHHIEAECRAVEG